MFVQLLEVSGVVECMNTVEKGFYQLLSPWNEDYVTLSHMFRAVGTSSQMNERWLFCHGP